MPFIAPQVDDSSVVQHPFFQNLPRDEQIKFLQGYTALPEEQKQKIRLNAQRQIPVPPQNDQRTTSDKVIDFLRPIVAPAIGTGVAALSAPFIAPETAGLGVPAVGMATTGLVDRLMQHMQNQVPSGIVSSAAGLKPGSFLSDTTNTAEMLGMNALGEKILSPITSRIGRAVSEYMHPGQVVGDIQKLNPTYSQYVKDYFGKPSGVSSWIEDTFGKSRKLASITGSAQAGARELESILPSSSADRIYNAGLKDQLNSVENGIGESRRLSNVYGKMNVSRVSLPNGMVVDQEGPIVLNNTINNIQQFRSSLRGKVLSDTDKSVYGILDNLDKNITSRVSKDFMGTTGVDKTVGINDLLDYKKIVDDMASSPKKSLLSGGQTSSDFMKSLSASLDKDIETSMYTWKQGPDALQSYRNGKFLDDIKDHVFDKSGLTELLKDPSVPPSTAVNKIIDDPKMLQSVLNKGSVDLNGAKLGSDNMRKDMAGYQLNRLLMNNSDIDPMTHSIGRINAKGIMDDLNKMGSESKDLLFSKEAQKNIGDLLSNLSKTQGEPQSAGWGMKTFLTHAGIGIGASLLGGSIAHGLEYGGAIAGYQMGGRALAKVMTNPKAARILVAASSGAPLGTSMQTAQKILSEALVGSVISAVDKNGSYHDVEMTRDGLKEYQK